MTAKVLRMLSFALIITITAGNMMLFSSCNKNTAGGEPTTAQDSTSAEPSNTAGGAAKGLSTVAPNGNSLLIGSNIFNFDSSEGFLTNTGRQQAAQSLLGVLRFPTRTTSPTHCAQLADKIKSLGIEPLVILPDTENVGKDSFYVDALNGKATLYEFGNENNYNGDKSKEWIGQKYADVWSQYIPQFKEINPDMKIGGPVVSHFDTTGSKYVRDFLTAVKDKPELWPDFISLHVYVAHGENWTTQKIMGVANTWGTGIDKIKSDCLAILGVELPIAVTEWNWNAVPEKTNDNRYLDPDFMTVFCDTVLDAFRDHGVWLSCQFMLAGDGRLNMMLGDGTPNPQYIAMSEWAKRNPPSAQIVVPEPSTLPPAAGTPAFKDIASSPYKDSINAIAALGILPGETEDQFKPDADVTRGELARALALIKGIDSSGYEASPFTDVDVADPLFQYALWASQNGVIPALSASNFNPSGSVTGGEAAEAVLKYAQAAGINLPTGFDTSPASQGSTANLKRGEAASVIKKLYDLSK